MRHSVSQITNMKTLTPKHIYPCLLNTTPITPAASAARQTLNPPLQIHNSVLPVRWDLRLIHRNKISFNSAAPLIPPPGRGQCESYFNASGSHLVMTLGLSPIQSKYNLTVTPFTHFLMMFSLIFCWKKYFFIRTINNCSVLMRIFLWEPKISFWYLYLCFVGTE